MEIFTDQDPGKTECYRTQPHHLVLRYSWNHEEIVVCVSEQRSGVQEKDHVRSGGVAGKLLMSF